MPHADDEFDSGPESRAISDQAASDAEPVPVDVDLDDTLPLDPDQEPVTNLAPESELGSEADSDFGQNEIEEAYQKALAVLEDAGWELDPSDSTAPSGDAEQAIAGSESTNGEPETKAGELAQTAGSIPTADSAATASAGVAASTHRPRLAAGTERQPSLDELEHSNVSPFQVIEASLFVGGTPLTSKKIGALLRNSFDVDFVERTIDELNDQYVAEGRPYEIRLGDGGYRLELRPEYEKLRQRAYGSGPREVKLSQDILEVLALVAYQQPISQEEVESHGKQNAGNLLRQLLRRDLVAIQRGEGGRKDIRYLTTPRFLTVFGIGSLDELPQPDDLARK